MKKFIISSREYNTPRAQQYQDRRAAERAAGSLASQRRDYVDSIEHDVKSYLSEEIDKAIFEPTLSQDVTDRWLANFEKWRSPYYNEPWYRHEDPLAHSANSYVRARPQYIEIVIDVFGLGQGTGNRGLEWIADLATGGTGAMSCHYMSKLPARMKRKLDEYKEMIADMLENYGFEILEAPRNSANGFLFKVTNDAYDALTRG